MPDGQLSLDPDPVDQSAGDPPPRDACGVFGVWSPDEDVAKLTYYGLYSLQHRGQESAGIAVSDGSRIVVYKDMGLVAQVFDESVLNTLRGYVAIGHCRYSTSGSSVWENAQPTFRATPSASLALGHNGNLINTLELADLLGGLLGGHNGAVAGRATSDTDVLTALFAVSGSLTGPGGAANDGAANDGAANDGAANDGAANDGAEPPSHPGVEAAALAALPLVRGAFSLVFMDEQTLYAARDPQGFRPLVLGRLARGWVV